MLLLKNIGKNIDLTKNPVYRTHTISLCVLILKNTSVKLSRAGHLWLATIESTHEMFTVLQEGTFLWALSFH